MVVNDYTVKIYDTVTCSVTINHVNYHQKFYVADIKINILGSDFIAKHNLVYKILDGKLFIFRNMGIFPTNISACIHTLHTYGDEQLRSAISMEQPIRLTSYNYKRKHKKH